ncbi:MAG: DUF349 domain-containing protein [Bacteroidales bacterium]|nr:DUF349 domain-containing protein [Bacteroidales bacterium]
MAEEKETMQQEEMELPVENTTEKKIYTNRQEILDRLAEIVNTTTDEVRDEINYLKLVYYKLRQQEVDAEMKKLLEGESDVADFESKPDDLEPRLKELLNIQKEARAAMVEARNQEMAGNLEKKREILKQMIAIAQDAGEVGQQYNAFIELQKQFKEVGAVDPKEVNDLWKQYNTLNEQFYDALKINKELRDYDFKKNLERKTELCEEAEKLGEAADVVQAFRRLQDLHEEWKGLGPVSPAVREEIWARFKAASTVVNKRHQDHFEKIKEQEAANEAGKIAICEKFEAIDINAIQTAKEWEEQTKIVLGFQEEWRKLGFANKKVNAQLFDRFRALCDAFFGAKANFFKGQREEQNANIEKKTALCEKAEALKESTEWRKTTDILVNLQKEWKNIGPVPHKVSSALWERFRGACDAFFEAKEKAQGGEKAEEKANLELKQAIVEKLKALKENLQSVEPQQVRDLMAEWNQVGHVPFKEKDKLYAAYKEVVDFFFENIDMKGQKARLNNFRERVKNIATEGKAVVQSERQKLQRQLERLQNDLKTYENNLGFLNAKSKSGNGMLALMERKKEDLKKEIEELKAKIDMLDE